MKHKMLSLALAMGMIAGLVFGIKPPVVTSAEVDDEPRSVPADPAVLNEIQASGSLGSVENTEEPVSNSVQEFSETEGSEINYGKINTRTNSAVSSVRAEASFETPQLSIDPLSMTLVSGYVYDNGLAGVGSHGYPLYSAIHITGADFDETIYTDPITGYYQIHLVTGTEYTFTTTPVIGGYDTIQDLVIPSGFTYTHDIFVSVLGIECTAPGYELLYDQGKGVWVCDMVTGGVVAGYVYDDNYYLPLISAEIVGDDVSTHSFSIPGDPDHEGLFWIFQPIEIYYIYLPLILKNSESGFKAQSGSAIQDFAEDIDFTASKEHYTSSTETVHVATDLITYQEFYLRAGLFEFDPPSLDVTMFVNDPAHEETLIIDNIGGSDATYGLIESPDAAWLSENPSSGIINQHGREFITITFDPVGAGLGLGNYYTQLDVNHNTPYTYPNISVTLHFFTSGTFNGTVTGLERCDINPAPLSNATVNFWKNDEIVYSTTTDENGFYTKKVQDGVYDIEVVRSNYVSEIITDISLPVDTVVTTDFELRLNAPCLTVIPNALEQTQATNTITTQTLTLDNSGAAPLNFYLSEIEYGVIPPDSLIQDPSFEIFDPDIPDNPYWDEYSDEAVTPLCIFDTCGYGTGTGPRTGFVWSWFGGVLGGDEGYVSQDVLIPSGNPFGMTFYVEQSFCGNGGINNFLALTIDGIELWRTDALDPACGDLGYRLVEIDLSSYADDQVHEIKFYSETVDVGGFFLDDAELNADVVIDISWLSEDQDRGTVLADSSLDITISYDSTGLDAGNYLAQLWLRQYPYPSILIPVTLNVE